MKTFALLLALISVACVADDTSSSVSLVELLPPNPVGCYCLGQYKCCDYLDPDGWYHTECTTDSACFVEDYCTRLPKACGGDPWPSP